MLKLHLKLIFGMKTVQTGHIPTKFFLNLDAQDINMSASDDDEDLEVNRSLNQSRIFDYFTPNVGNNF